MLVMLRAAVPLFVTVISVTALCVLTTWFAKATFGGARVTAGAVPVPVNGMVCGLPVASSAKLTFALLAPIVVGAKFTPTLQFAPAASVLAPSGHAVPVVGAPRVNCVGSVPVTVMLVIFSVAVPLLVSVTSFVAVLVPVR
jgi:hypothetical protein